jgi:hypothetical protein
MKLALAALFLLGGESEAWASGGLRCEAKVVSVGLTSFEVRAKCGDPVHIESSTETRVVRRRDPATGTVVERRAYVPIERWTYSRGPNDLIRSLIFENGRLVEIKTEGQAPKGDASPESCERRIHSTGDTTAEVLLRCGPPADVSRWYEEVAVGDEHFERYILVPYERWIYNLGPHRFLRILTFEGGRLVRQETGDKGY